MENGTEICWDTLKCFFFQNFIFTTRLLMSSLIHMYNHSPSGFENMLYRSITVDTNMIANRTPKIDLHVSTKTRWAQYYILHYVYYGITHVCSLFKEQCISRPDYIVINWIFFLQVSFILIYIYRHVSKLSSFRYMHTQYNYCIIYNTFSHIFGFSSFMVCC